MWRAQRAGTQFLPSEVLTAPIAPEDRVLASDAATDRHRAIFISDIHLGTRGCKASYLLDFLRHIECDTLYLVGDIIDGWALKKGFYWPQAHNDVVQKVLRKARKGTRVIYVPGYHDELARQFTGLDFGQVAIRQDAVHVLKDGRRLWVVHGDFADGVMLHARRLAYVGDSLYEFVLWLNSHFNRVRVALGLTYWSLSQYLKHRVKNAVSFITGFEQVLLREARRRGYDGVVCGHIHKAGDRAVVVSFAALPWVSRFGCRCSAYRRLATVAARHIGTSRDDRGYDVATRGRWATRRGATAGARSAATQHRVSHAVSPVPEGDVPRARRWTYASLCGVISWPGERRHGSDPDGRQSCTKRHAGTSHSGRVAST